MKKSVILTLGLMLIASASCEKGVDDNNQTSQDPFDNAPALPAPDPLLASEAVTINFANDQIVPYESIQLTQNGTAIIKKRLPSDDQTRATVIDLYIVGTFQRVNGVIVVKQLNSNEIICSFSYEAEQPGRQEVKVSLTIGNDAPIESIAVAVKVEGQQDDVIRKLEQKWKVEKCELTHTIKGVTLSKRFPGCNINELIEYAKTIAKFDEELKEEYDVAFVEFAQPNVVTIAYNSKSSDVGNWNWTKKETRELTFSWVNQVSTKILKESSCTFGYDNYEEYYTLTLSAHITDDKEQGDYLINLVLFVKPM